MLDKEHGVQFLSTNAYQIQPKKSSSGPEDLNTFHALHTYAHNSFSVVLTVNAYRAYTIMVFESLIWLHG